MQLRATILRAGKTAAGVVIPDEFLAALGSSRHPRVRVTVRGHTFRSSIASMAGRFMLPMSVDVRRNAGVAPGDEVDLEIELDTEPRQVDVPADLAEALATDGAARERFETLSYSNQRRVVMPVESARTEETRRRRVERAVADLREGRA